jgi:hypothetical protein
MRTVVLYRPSEMSERELAEATAALPCIDRREQAQRGDLVVGRYSVLPYYAELEQDLVSRGASLINSAAEHQFLADLGQWTSRLGDLTFRTWAEDEPLPEGVAFVVKGETNSRKDQWSTHMFAADREAAAQVRARLREDGLFSSQKIFFREFEPLMNYAIGVGDGAPISCEFRFFVANGVVLCGGFYWSLWREKLTQAGIDLDPSQVPSTFLEQVIERIGTGARFYTIDVAFTRQGAWRVVELNDAQMAGLSGNDPAVLYRRLAEVL